MKQILKKISHSDEETNAVAGEFAKIIPKTAFVAMYGDLGAGKTAFVRGMLDSLIPDAEFAGSPTYALVNEYEGNGVKLSHFDMYRITDDDDLYSIGFYDYTDGIVVTEWSENIEYALPEKRYEVHICKISDSDREILITETGDTE